MTSDTTRKTRPYSVFAENSTIANPLATFETREELQTYLVDQLNQDPDTKLYWARVYGPAWVEVKKVAVTHGV